MTIQDHHNAVHRAEATVERHKARPRSDSYRKALIRLQDARHAALAAELQEAR